MATSARRFSRSSPAGTPSGSPGATRGGFALGADTAVSVRALP